MTVFQAGRWDKVKKDKMEFSAKRLRKYYKNMSRNTLQSLPWLNRLYLTSLYIKQQPLLLCVPHLLPEVSLPAMYSYTCVFAHVCLVLISLLSYKLHERRDTLVNILGRLRQSQAIGSAQQRFIEHLNDQIGVSGWSLVVWVWEVELWKAGWPVGR